MKQKINFLFYQLLLMLMLLPLQASAQNNKEVIQTQLGKEVIVVGEDDIITFKDFKGDTDLRAYGDKAQAVTVFKSGVPGKVVMLKFNVFDVRTESGWPGYVNIYSGEADPENTFVFAESTSDIQKTGGLPKGNLLEERLEGKFTDRTYFSTADDGSLSVGFMYNQSCSCSGFEATVQLVTPEDMHIVSSGSMYDDVTNTLTGKQNIAFAGVYVETEGFGSPDHLTKIVFNASKNDNAVDVSALRLYRGRYADIDFKNVDPIDVTINKIDATHFELSLDYGLATGMNNFTLVGDFKQDAAIGAQVCIEVPTRGEPGGPM